MAKAFRFFSVFSFFLGLISEYELSTLQQEAKTRWLKPPEVHFILQNHERYNLNHEAPQKPPSKFDFAFFRLYWVWF